MAKPPFLPPKNKAADDFGAPPEVGMMGAAPKPKTNLSARNNAQETPDEEQGFHEEGAKPAPTPESVAYHGEADVCSVCEYYGGGNCLFLGIDVDAGGHCQRYEAKSEDAGEGQEQLGLGGQEEVGETA